MSEPIAGTLGAALESAADRHGDRPALLGLHQQWTWFELHREVGRMAWGLHRLGIRRGDAVAFMLSKRPETVVAFLAVAELGAVVVPVNVHLRPNRVGHQFGAARVSAVLIEARFDTVLGGVGVGRPLPSRVAYIGEVGAHGGPIPNAPEGLERVTVAGRASDVCYINYTSGSTGQPKGAPTTHRNILANARGTAAAFEFSEKDVFMCLFAVFAHPHELFHRALVTGAAMVVLDSLNPRVIRNVVERFKVTWIMAVPSFYELLFADGDGPRTEGMVTVRAMEAGGAHIPEASLQRLQDRSGGRIVPVWGCTETTGVAIVNGPERRRHGATGWPVPGYTMQVLDPNGREATVGQEGELVIRGPAVTRGYVESDASGREFQDGVYRTGDAFAFDDEGWLYFRGRFSEMLKVAGQRVYPVEIQRVLLAYPSVRQAAVVSVEDRLRGQVPVALVTVDSKRSVTPTELMRHCRGELEAFKVPRSIVVVDAIPMMESGKVDAVNVRRQVAEAEAGSGRDD